MHDRQGGRGEACAACATRRHARGSSQPRDTNPQPRGHFVRKIVASYLSFPFLIANRQRGDAVVGACAGAARDTECSTMATCLQRIGGDGGGTECTYPSVRHTAHTEPFSRDPQKWKGRIRKRSARVKGPEGRGMRSALGEKCLAVRARGSLARPGGAW